MAASIPPYNPALEGMDPKTRAFKKDPKDHVIPLSIIFQDQPLDQARCMRSCNIVVHYPRKPERAFSFHPFEERDLEFSLEKTYGSYNQCRKMQALYATRLGISESIPPVELTCENPGHQHKIENHIVRSEGGEPHYRLLVNVPLEREEISLPSKPREERNPGEAFRKMEVIVPYRGDDKPIAKLPFKVVHKIQSVAEQYFTTYY